MSKIKHLKSRILNLISFKRIWRWITATRLRKVLSSVLAILILLIAVRLAFFIKNTEAAWWPGDGTNVWAKRQRLTLTNNSGSTRTNGTTIAINVNTKDLVAQGKLQTDCDDIRVIYDTGSSPTVLDRVVVFSGGGSCTTSDATKVYFKLQADLTNGTSSSSYYMYYASPNVGAPANPDNAFDISSKDASLVCPFDGSTTCAANEPAATATGALRYSGSNTALSFDGRNDVVDLGSPGTILGDGTRSFTIEMWMYLKEIPHSSYWASEKLLHATANTAGCGGNDALFLILYQGAGDPSDGSFILPLSPNDGCQANTSTSFNTTTNNTWYYLTASYDATTKIMKSYLNGNYISQAVWGGSSTIQWNSNLLLGSWSTDSSYIGEQGFRGLVDELRISDVVRYNSNFAPPTSPFIRDQHTKLLMHFDENGDDPRNTGVLKDDSGNGYNGTIYGSPTFVAGVPGVDESSTFQSQSHGGNPYVGHAGIFTEEATTNKITNPSFEHATYGTGWSAGSSLSASENTDSGYVQFGSKDAFVQKTSLTEYNDPNSNQYLYDATTDKRLAQGFQIGSAASVAVAALSLDSNIASSDYFRLDIETDSSGVPSGTIVTNGTSECRSQADLPGSVWRLFYFRFPTPPSLSASTQYHLVLRSYTDSGCTTEQSAVGDIYTSWEYQSSGAYANGDRATMNESGTWSTQTGQDHSFYLYSDSNSNFTISTDPNSTATHTLSAYIYQAPEPRTANAAISTDNRRIQLIWEGTAQSTTTFTDVGRGWYRLSYTAATTDASNTYGVRISGGDFYIDGVQLEAKSSATSYADGSLTSNAGGTDTYFWDDDCDGVGPEAGEDQGADQNAQCSTRIVTNLQYATSSNLSANPGSISFWVKPQEGITAVTGNQYIFDMRQAASNRLSVFMKAADDDMAIDTNDTQTSSTGITMAAGGWQHFVFTYDFTADQYKLYQNGNATPIISTTTSLSAPTLDTNFFLGSDYNNANSYNGTISDFRAYNAVLTTTEIADLYYAGLVSHSDQFEEDAFSDNKGERPVGIWHFDESSGTTAHDSSTYGNDLTISGATWDTTSVGSNSMLVRNLQFDGKNDYISQGFDKDFSFGTDSFSISGWFKHPSTITDTDTILSRYITAGYKVYLNSSGYICFGIDDDSTWGPDDEACSTSAQGSYADSKWHHFEAVKSGTTSITVYVDGNPVGQDLTISATGSLSSNASLMVGGQESNITTVGAVTVSSDEGTGGDDASWSHRNFYDPINNRYHVLYIDSGSDIHSQSTAYDSGTVWSDGTDIKAGTYDYDDFSCSMETDPSNTYLHCTYSPSGAQTLNYVRCELTGTNPYITCGSEQTVYTSGDVNDDINYPRITTDSNDCVLITADFMDNSAAAGDKNQIWLWKEGGTCGDGTYSDVAGSPFNDGFGTDTGIQTDVAGYNAVLPVGIESFGDEDVQLYWIDTDSATAAQLETNNFTGATNTFGTQRQLDSDIEYATNSVKYWSVITGSQNVTFALDDTTTDLDAYVITSKGSALSSQNDTILNTDGTTAGLSQLVTAAVDTNASGSDDIWLFAVDNTDTVDIYYNTSANGGVTWGSSGTLWVDTYNTLATKYLSAVYNSETCDIMVTWLGDTGDPVGIDTKIINTGNCTTATQKYWQGNLDEITVYPYARSATQVKADILGTSTSQAYGSQSGDPLTQGLIGYWKLDESSGNASDSSGNSNTLTNNSSMVFGAGKFGNSAQCDGTADYLNTASTISGIKSVSFWAYPAAAANNYFINLVNSSAYITINSSGVVSATGFSSPAIYVNGVLNGTVSATAWSQIAVTTDTSINANAFAVGLTNDGSNHFCTNTSKLDSVRLYNRTLSPAEVSQLYNWAPGPVGYWKMDEGSGTSAYDSSGNGNTGSLTNGPTWVTGKFGKATNFDGGDTADDYINAGQGTTLANIFDGGGSVSGWFYARSDGEADLARVIAKNARWYLATKNQSGNNIQLSFEQHFPAGSAYWNTSNLLINTWHHFAITYDNSSTSNDPIIYIDGTSVTLSETNTASGTRIDDSSTDLYLGNSSASADRTFDGYLDDIKIYNYTRTPSQIIEDMNASHPAPGSPVGSAIGKWKFDEGYGDTADNSGSSGTALNASLAGSDTCPGDANCPTWSNAGKFGKSLSFDGSDDYASVSDNSALSFGNGTDDQPFSISTWFNSGNVGTMGILLGKYDAIANELEYRFFYQGDKLRVQLYTDSTGSQIGRGGRTTLSNGSWYHAVFTYDGSGTASGIKLYLNGIRDDISDDNAGSYAAMENTTSPLYMGANSSTITNVLNGYLDEAQIFNSELTADQVKQLYNQGSGTVWGSTSTSATGTADWSTQRIYCPPGDTSGNCAAGQDPSPIMEWRLDDNTGTTANDTSNNNNSGTLTNFEQTDWKNGKFGSALTFDGVDEHILRTDDDDLDFGGSQDFTLQAWIKHAPATDQEVILSKEELTGADGGYVLQMESDGDITCAWDNDNSGFPTHSISSTAATYDDDQWHLITCSRTVSILDLYIDGRLITESSTATASMANDDTFYVGRDGAGTSTAYWTGQIDQISVFRYARKQIQIGWDYSKGLPTHWWKLDENSGSNAYDSGLQTNNGTLTGGTWVTAKRSYGLDLNGSSDYVEVADNDNLDFTANDNFSLEAWVNRDTFTTTDTIIAKKDDSEDLTTTGYSLVIRATDTIRFYGYDGTNSTFCTTTTTITSSGWNHIVLVYDRNGTGFIRLYLNGQPENSCILTSIQGLSNSRPLRIGANSAATPGQHFDGKIDNVRIFTSALTAQQVKNLYNEGALYYGPASGTP